MILVHCGHSVCQSCIEEKIREGCPECGHHILDDKECDEDRIAEIIDSLPINKALLSILKSQLDSIPQFLNDDQKIEISKISLLDKIFDSKIDLGKHNDESKTQHSGQDQQSLGASSFILNE